MEALLYCDERARCVPGEALPEALVPYCNIPLLARILRALPEMGMTGVTLCRTDPETRAFVETLPLRIPVRWEAPARFAADTLVLHRLSLPGWDMGELLSLVGEIPVRLCTENGAETSASLFPAGSAPGRPETSVRVLRSEFPRADSPAQYLAIQQTLLQNGGMERFRIGQGTRLGKGARVDEATILGSDCLIGAHVVLEHCVLGDGVQIGAGAVIRDCVLGRGALVDRQVMLEGRQIPAGGVVAPQSQAVRHPALCLHAEDGICRELPRWNNAESALQAGAAMTVLGKNLAIGFAAPAREAFALAAAAGAAAQGAQVWSAGQCTLSQLIHICRTVNADAMLWVDENGALQPFLPGGFAPETAQLRRIRQALSAGLSTRIPECGKLLPAGHFLPLWEEDIRAILPALPCEVAVSCGNALLRDAAQRLFAGGTGERIVLSLSEDGTQVSAYTPEAGMVHHDQLLLLSLLSFRETGEALALPADFHPAAEDFAARYGGRILRLHSPGTSPQAARFWQRQGVCRDGIRLFAHIQRVLAGRRVTLAQAAALLPPMVTVRRLLSTTLSSQEVERLRRENPDPAVHLIRPAFSSLTRLLVHASDLETAAELCDFWEKRTTRVEDAGE